MSALCPGLFERLSGPSADIDTVSIGSNTTVLCSNSLQIFELTEEFEENALDTRDLDLLQPVEPGHQRRPSQMSMSPKIGRRVSNNSDLSRSSHHPSSSLPKNEQHPSGPSSVPGPRHRLTSIMTRGVEVAQSAASPLAQIFQPLIFDDDIPDDHQHIQDTHGVSYGPATRRRLSSMQWRNHPPDTGPGAPSTALRRFPTHGSNESRSKALPSQTLSESPDSRTQPQETAEEIEDEGPHPPLEKRLDSIEKRQRRIEDLLVQLSDRIH